MSRRKPTRAKQLGVTDEQYDAMLKAQGGGCAICGNPPKTRRLDTDHDHATREVRGVLDHRCNRTLPTWVTTAWLDSAYRYLVRHELLITGRLRYNEEDRGFETPCWVWQRAIHSAGYGVIRVRGELLYVHRLMYHGLIADGEDVHHRCEVRACIRPTHLQTMTALDHSHHHERTTQATCKRGHPWTPQNTYLRPDGSGRRQCRACIALRARR